MPGAGRTFATTCCNILPFWHKAGILGQFEFEHSAVYSTVCNCAWMNFLLSLVPHLIIWVAANVPLQSFFDWNQCTGSNWRKIMKCQTFDRLLNWLFYFLRLLFKSSSSAQISDIEVISELISSAQHLRAQQIIFHVLADKCTFISLICPPLKQFCLFQKVIAPLGKKDNNTYLETQSICWC